DAGGARAPRALAGRAPGADRLGQHGDVGTAGPAALLPPMTRRVGAVDIGTNSTRLLVADVSDEGGIAEVERLLEITRLGDRVDADGRLSDAAVARVDAVLERYAARAEELEVATSAVRDAENGREFLDGTVARHGFEPRLLTGEEEAEMTYRGVCSRAAVAESVLICDIGGGSTELILGGREGVTDRASLDVGCVRMSERHLHADPPATAELDALREEVAEALPRRLTDAARGLVGVAGTVTTLATIDMGLEVELPE